MQLKLKLGVVIFEDEDISIIMKHAWHVNSNGYARTNNYYNGKSHPIYMHQLILGKKSGYDIDHINGNKLDNRRSNLRYLTRTFNNHNTDKTTARSGVRGVYIILKTGKWFGRVVRSGIYHDSEAFSTIEEAKRARGLLYRTWIEPGIGKKADADLAQAHAFGMTVEEYFNASEA